jgi:hypothetical protein
VDLFITQEELDRIAEALNAVVQTAPPEGINIVEALERAFRILGYNMDVHEVLRRSGIQEHRKIAAATNTAPGIRIVK